MNKRICIWCRRDSSKATFNNLAHTIPQAIGGTDICENVCDDCNRYFGNGHNGIPAVETIFKETFNISRARFLSANNEIGKNKALSHFKSIYFNVNFKKGTIGLKPAFKLRHGFQLDICRQLKKGLYKVYLEETERQNKNALESKYDFIREYSRYNIGEYPIFYFPRKVPLIFNVPGEANHPKFHFFNQMEFQIKDYSFFEFEFLGHLFSLPISRNYNLMFDDYWNKTNEAKKIFFHKAIDLKYLTDIDLTLRIMND